MAINGGEGHFFTLLASKIIFCVLLFCLNVVVVVVLLLLLLLLLLFTRCLHLLCNPIVHAC